MPAPFAHAIRSSGTYRSTVPSSATCTCDDACAFGFENQPNCDVADREPVECRTTPSVRARLPPWFTEMSLSTIFTLTPSGQSSFGRGGGGGAWPLQMCASRRSMWSE